MGIFDRFPYSSTHEMNLDFMLGKATEIAEDMQQVTAGMEQVQAGLTAISEKTEQATQAAAQAAQSASSIEGSVTAAEEAAEEAQMHNESAQTWANNAMTYKADCQRSATEAAASATSAAQAATAAAGSEDTVAQYAQAANASAQSAANNNDSAHQYANQASASASNATFHSSNAQTAATNANTSATNAETAATNAQTAATRTAALKDDCETLHRMCVAAVDQASTQAVNAANSAAQAAATKTDVETLVESLPEDFTDLNNTVNQLSDEIDEINVIDNVLSYVITKNEMTYDGNYYPGSAGDKTELATQYWYERLADSDFSIWCNPDLTYSDIMIAVYNNGTASRANFVARYRKNDTSNTLPTAENKLAITSGQLLVVSVYNNAAFSFVTDGIPIGKTFKTGIQLNQEQLNQAQGKMSVSVESDRYIIKHDNITMNFAHIVNTGTRADLWNFAGITKGLTTIISQGTDIVGVVRETGESDYMGGVHGDETNTNFYILADGNPITENCECERLDILMVSHLTRVSTGENVIDRYVHISIKNNTIEVETTFKCLADNFSVMDALAGGMFSYYENDKVFALTNVGVIAGSGNAGKIIVEDHDLYTATVVTNNATIICENLIGNEVPETFGQAYYYGNEQNPRMKLYLAELKNTTWNTGDYWKGKARYTIL